MKKEDFAIAFSEKDGEEAIKEISLKIKLNFPKRINLLIILFTSHYLPSNILKTLDLTLKPQKILGLQAPFLIFEEEIIQKGIVACCINKEGVKLEEFFLKNNLSQEIETSLRLSFSKLKKKNTYLLSFLSPSINPSSYLDIIRLSLGKVFNLVGGGFITKYSPSTYQIVNNTVNEGLVTITMEGLHLDFLRSGGYLPLGKPFTITKTVAGNIIREINGQPAASIYRHYLEEKSESFIKNRLFTLYPLGIKKNGTIRLVSITDCLEDGSLMYVGEVKEKDSGHIMLLDSDLLLKELKRGLESLKEKGQGLVFILNSLVRKKILKESSAQEIKLIKQTLGWEFKIIGLYSDYFFISDREKGYIDIEAGNLQIILWQ